MQLFEPVEELLDHWLADKRLAMLRHQHFRIETTHPRGPGPAGAIARHITPVEALHVAYMVGKVFHRDMVRTATYRRADIAGEQDAAGRIIKVEVTHRVQKVGRYRHQRAVAQRDLAALIRQGNHPLAKITAHTPADKAGDQVGQETAPQL